MDSGQYRLPRLVDVVNLDVAVVQNLYHFEQSGPAVGDFVWFAWDLALGPVIHNVSHVGSFCSSLGGGYQQSGWCECGDRL